MGFEFNDVCPSQFKCVRALYRFVSRNKRCIRVYFETSHDKGKSDGLGGVVKGYASREVASENVLIRNAKQLYEICKGKLEVTNLEKGKMLNRLFFFVSKDDIVAYRANFPPSGI